MCKRERKETRDSNSVTINLGANQNSCGITRFKPTYCEDNRISPDLVTAFKKESIYPIPSFGLILSKLISVL